MTELVSKLKTALKSIHSYIEGKKPATLDEAKHMLALIDVIASETLAETKTAKSAA